MLDQPLRTLAGPALARAASAFGPRVGVNAFSLLAFVAGAAAVGCISLHQYWAGLALLALNRLAAALASTGAGADGFGALLQKVLNVAVNAGLVLAFAWAVPDRALVAGFLLFALAVMWTAQSSAPRSQAALAGNTELFIGFAVACINPAWFSFVCYALGVLAFVGAGLTVAAASRLSQS
jgi:hypothetical protein